MSTTDQFPPRHLLPEEEEEEEGEQGKTQQSHKGNDAPTATTSQGTHDEETSKQPQLALPAPSSSSTNGASSTANDDDDSRSLNVATGNRVALDELGPMVVNPNGTLSRIHNWSEMIPSERERTLRVLGARNKLRMDSIRGQEGEGEQGDK